MAEKALLDTGALVAFLHRDDADHHRVVEALRTFRGTLLTTEAVLTESTHLLAATTGGARACLDFVLRGGAVLVPASRESLLRCRTILEDYADLPADLADATLLALAEEFEAWTVFTLDRREFSVYRGRNGEAFRVLP